MPSLEVRRAVVRKAERAQKGRARLSESLADHLRQRIFDGVYGDDLLPRLDVLTSEYGVSAPSMREALRVLETEGLITIRRGNTGGAAIHRPNARHVARIVAMVLQSDHVPLRDVARCLEELEPLAAQLCARRRDRRGAAVPALRANLDAARDVIDDGEAFTRHMNGFHSLVIAQSGNLTLQLVSGAVESLWTAHTQGWSDRNAREGRPPPRSTAVRALRVHEQITDAIEAGDDRLAASLMRRHFDPRQFHDDAAVLDEPVDSEFIRDLFDFGDA